MKHKFPEDKCIIKELGYFKSDFELERNPFSNNVFVYDVVPTTNTKQSFSNLIIKRSIDVEITASMDIKRTTDRMYISINARDGIIQIRNNQDKLPVQHSITVKKPCTLRIRKVKTLHDSYELEIKMI